MKSLIIFDNWYPYGYAESFLETEVPIISSFFDKVAIIAVSGGDWCGKVRQTPDNVIYFSGEINNKKTEKMMSVIKAIPFFRGGMKSFLDAAFDYYSEIRFTGIIRVIDSLNLKKDDEIILYSYWFYMHAYIALKVQNRMQRLGYDNVKTISRAHGFDVYKERQLLKYFPQRMYMLENISGVWVCSEHGKSYLKEEYVDFRDKIRVGRLGTIDFGFKKIQDRKERVIVSCSSVISLKQVNKIAAAIVELIREGYPIVWHHFGDGNEISRVKQIVKPYLYKNVFIHGQVCNKEVVEFYRCNQVDLFVNASTTEGIPVSIMEAMSFGIPIVAPDVGGVGELVKTDTGCVLMKTKIDVSDIVDAILSVSEKPYEERKRTTIMVREFWKNNFEAKKNYLEFVKEIIEV